MSAQLLLFEETQEEKLSREVNRLQQQVEKLRKGQFAKMGELKKEINFITHELEVLKMAMCQYGKE